MTCAHVVNSALGRGLREQAQPGESDRVQVEFPLTAGGCQCARTGRNVGAAAEVGGGGGDVAGLVLTEVAPAAPPGPVRGGYAGARDEVAGVRLPREDRRGRRDVGGRRP